jgi:LTXXQ motif family protein
MRTAASMIAGISLLLIMPVAAQQAPPNAPASPNAGVSPPAGMTGGTGMMGAQGRGGMGMMMGSRGMGGGGDEDEDKDMHRSHHHDSEGRGIPMQIIINIGPENRVETEERGGGGAGGGPRWRMMGHDGRGRSLAGHIEAHLDYLRDQLQLTPEQQPAWDRFANAVRDAVSHTRPPGPAGLAQGQSLEQRLASQEDMLNSRLEALRSAHAALSSLTSALNESQKHTLDEISTEFMPGRSMMQSRWR